MARKPSDIVQPNLRIREELRRKLARKADDNRVSLNVEMTRRLERSLDQETVQSIAVSATSLETITLRSERALLKLEALLEQLEQHTAGGAP
jgi:hypothetical protein